MVNVPWPPPPRYAATTALPSVWEKEKKTRTKIDAGPGPTAHSSSTPQKRQNSTKLSCCVFRWSQVSQFLTCCHMHGPWVVEAEGPGHRGKPSVGRARRCTEWSESVGRA